MPLLVEFLPWIWEILLSTGAFAIFRRRRAARHLPDDIVINILSRLSAESVMRCGRVCRQWRSLTKTDFFIKLHLQRSSPVIFRRDIVYSDDSWIQNFHLYDHASNGRRNFKKFRLEKEKLMRKDEKNNLICSCDGLLLFMEGGCGRRCYFLNPVTQEHVGIYCPVGGSVCGFFFHPLTNEYKVLYVPNPGYPASQYCIYTLGGSDSWRMIKPHPSKYSPSASQLNPAICNGALHWMTCCNDQDPPCSSAILAFRMDTEDFCVLPHPGNKCRDRSRTSHETMHLLVKDERLTFCHLGCYKRLIDIWTMEDYTKRVWIWEWEVNLDLTERPSFTESIRFLQLHNGELWLDCPVNGLFIYNLNRRTVRKLEKPPLPSTLFLWNYGYRHESVAYKKSVVRLPESMYCTTSPVIIPDQFD